MAKHLSMWGAAPRARRALTLFAVAGFLVSASSAAARTTEAAFRADVGTFGNSQVESRTDYNPPGMLNVYVDATSTATVLIAGLYAAPTITADTSAPSRPGSLTRTGATTTSISVSWSAARDDVAVAGYGLYVGSARVGTTTGTTYTFNGLQCGRRYYLYVDAFDAAGNTSAKRSLRTRTTDCPAAPAPDTQAPSTPSGLTQSAASLGTITIAWNASTDNVGVTGYGVYVNNTSAGNATTPGYIVSGLNCGTQYSLAVDAFDAAGNRSAKASLTASTTACPAPAPAPSGGDLYLSPTGSDANPCSATAPCRNLQRAYDLAQPGANVVLAGGSYGSQRVTGTKSTPAVVFKPAAGATVSLGGVDVYADNLEIRDVAASYWQSYAESSGFTARNLDISFFQIFGSSNISIVGGDIGPSYTPGGTSTVNYISYSLDGTIAPTNVLVDGVYFHDFRRGSTADHMECLMVIGGNGITVRNSRFVRCDIFDVFFTQWAGPAPPKNVVLEDNFFNASTTDGNQGGSYLAVQFSAHMNLMAGYTIRNNSFAMPVGIDSPVSNVSFVGNVMPYNGCVSGVTYSFNVIQDSLGGRCGSTDKVVSGARYGSDKLGFVNPTGGDLHLTATSPAINSGSPTNYALNDIDGQGRPMGAAPDAGADEKS